MATDTVGVIDQTRNAPAQAVPFGLKIRENLRSLFGLGPGESLLSGLGGGGAGAWGNLRAMAGSADIPGAQASAPSPVAGPVAPVGAAPVGPVNPALGNQNVPVNWGLLAQVNPGATIGPVQPMQPMGQPVSPPLTPPAQPAALPNAQPNLLTEATNLLQTPAIQQALIALGQGIAGAGNPVNVIGDAGTQMVQGQLLQNVLAEQGAGKPAPRTGASSTAGATPEIVEAGLRQSNQLRQFEQQQEALGYEGRRTAAAEMTATAQLMRAMQEGNSNLQGWQLDDIKEQVAVEYYPRARQLLLSSASGLATLADMERVLGSEQTGINVPRVFSLLKEFAPEEFIQATSRAQQIARGIEAGGPTSDVLEPTVTTAEQVRAIPVNTTFRGPDGVRYRKVNEEEIQAVE